MELKPNYPVFKNEIKNRSIEYLVHFTPTLNLLSILEQKKLLSRSVLESLDIKQYDILDYVKFTDDVRYDDKSYLNLSISSPNTFLFSKFRDKTSSDMSIKWCVIKIDPKHIYDSETLFSVTNAASSSAKYQFGISGDIDKFLMLFSDELNINSRNGVRQIVRRGIQNKFPTDLQAEVLIKHSIPEESIISVCFETQNDLAETKAAMSEFNTSNFIVDPKIFSPSRINM